MLVSAFRSQVDDTHPLKLASAPAPGIMQFSVPQDEAIVGGVCKSEGQARVLELKRRAITLEQNLVA